jgi:hypothetical protein
MFGRGHEPRVDQAEGRPDGENEPAARRGRVTELDIQPITEAARDRFAEGWRMVQSTFVDHPGGALEDADELITDLMRERGYPMDDFDQRATDIAADHPQVVEDYRAGHAISIAAAHDRATTEDLRRGLVHFRALLEELLVVPGRRAAALGDEGFSWVRRNAIRPASPS